MTQKAWEHCNLLSQDDTHAHRKSPLKSVQIAGGVLQKCMYKIGGQPQINRCDTRDEYWEVHKQVFPDQVCIVTAQYNLKSQRENLRRSKKMDQSPE